MSFNMRSILNNFLIIYMIIILQTLQINAATLNLNKRSLLPNGNLEDLLVSDNNQIQNNFDEYPMIVPKRAAILLDRLMVALHHALEDEKDGSRKISDVYGNGKNHQFDKDKYNTGGFIQLKNPSESILKNLVEEIEKGRYDIYNNNEGPDTLNVRDLKPSDENDYKKITNENDSSGRSTGRVYWRCYFNAVSCF